PGVSGAPGPAQTSIEPGEKFGHLQRPDGGILQGAQRGMAIRVGIIGAGKMGLSHFAIANALPEAAVVAVCDTSRYVLSVLRKYAGVQTFTHHDEMIVAARPEAVLSD